MEKGLFVDCSCIFRGITCSWCSSVWKPTKCLHKGLFGDFIARRVNWCKWICSWRRVWRSSCHAEQSRQYNSALWFEYLLKPSKSQLSLDAISGPKHIIFFSLERMKRQYSPILALGTHWMRMGINRSARIRCTHDHHMFAFLSFAKFRRGFWNSLKVEAVRKRDTPSDCCTFRWHPCHCRVQGRPRVDLDGLRRRIYAPFNQ